jgi:cytochrome P450
MNPFLAKNGIHKFWPAQQSQARSLLKALIDKPTDFQSQIRIGIGRSIIKSTYGVCEKEAQDEFIDVADRAMKALGEAAHAGTYLVDFIPALKHIPSWFPFAKFKRDAAEWKILTDNMVNLPFDHTKRDMVEGNLCPSIVQTLLESKTLTPEEERRLRYCAGTLFFAGADTTVSTIASFILAMTLYPDIQRKAQQEIDTVVGRDNLPAFEDRPNLPYVNALVKEIARWAPVTPTSVMHSVTEDDTYEGYFIEKDTTMVANVWAMSQDPLMYPDPQRFSPERYLPDEKGGVVAQDPYSFTFGFGRRTCLGMWYADATIFMNIVSMLHSFNITKEVDELGREITPEVAFTGGFISHPMPFKCKITPRSEHAVALIRSELTD